MSLRLTNDWSPRRNRRSPLRRLTQLLHIVVSIETRALGKSWAGQVMLKTALLALLVTTPTHAETVDTWLCTYDGRLTKLVLARDQVIFDNSHYSLVSNVEVIVGTAVAPNLSDGTAAAFTILLDMRTGALATGGAVTANPGEVTTKHGSCVRN
jgi:hypothetical protein